MNALILAETGQLFWAGTMAVLSAACFCLIAIAYKIGQPRRILPLHIVTVLSVVGAAFYGFGAARDGVSFANLPVAVLVAGLAGGVSQYVTIRMIAVALRMGPLSALWCAISLSFLPTLPYAYFIFGQGMHIFQYLGVMAAVGCVVTAAVANKAQPIEPAEPALPVRPKVGSRLAYFSLLVLLMLLNSVSNLAILDISHRRLDIGLTLWDVHYQPFLVIFYISLGGLCLCDLLYHRKLNAGVRNMLLLGLPAAVGSIAGIYLQGCASKLGGAVIYAIAGAAGIVFTAAVATAFFKEKRTALWYLTMGLGAAAVVLGYV